MKMMIEEKRTERGNDDEYKEELVGGLDNYVCMRQILPSFLNFKRISYVSLKF